MKHICLRCLFISSLVHDNELSVHKISGLVNPADVMTKHLDQVTRMRLMDLSSFVTDWREEPKAVKGKSKKEKGGDAEEEFDDED